MYMPEYWAEEDRERKKVKKFIEKELDDIAAEITLEQLDEYICCSGYECGCQGSLVYDQWLYWYRKDKNMKNFFVDAVVRTRDEARELRHAIQMIEPNVVFRSEYDQRDERGRWIVETA